MVRYSTCRARQATTPLTLSPTPIVSRREQAVGDNRDERERLVVLQADEARAVARRRAAEELAELQHRADNEVWS